MIKGKADSACEKKGSPSLWSGPRESGVPEQDLVAVNSPVAREIKQLIRIGMP